MGGRGDLFVAAAEGEEVLLEGVEVWEVVGGDDLALDDGEVDLGLVEPAGADGGVSFYRQLQAIPALTLTVWKPNAEREQVDAPHS